MQPIDQKADIKKFFKKFAVLVIMLIILDQLFGLTLRHYYSKIKYGTMQRTTYVLNTTKADLLIFGSSRADHHYVPSVFEKSLHFSTYNCGRDGCDLIYYTGTITAVLQRYTPKMIVIDLLPNELSLADGRKYTALLPYVNNPTIDSFIKSNDALERFKLLSKTYSYNSLLVPIVVGNVSHSFRDGDQGYIKLDGTMDGAKKKGLYNKQNTIIDARVKMLNDLLDKLDKKNIRTAVVISPSYFRYPTNDSTIQILNNLTSRYKNIRFFNYENSASYSSYELYHDTYHLNSTGSVKFSQDLADTLMKKFHISDN